MFVILVGLSPRQRSKSEDSSTYSGMSGCFSLASFHWQLEIPCAYDDYQFLSFPVFYCTVSNSRLSYSSACFACRTCSLACLSALSRGVRSPYESTDQHVNPDFCTVQIDSYEIDRSRSRSRSSFPSPPLSLLSFLTWLPFHVWSRGSTNIEMMYSANYGRLHKRPRLDWFFHWGLYCHPFISRPRSERCDVLPKNVLTCTIPRRRERRKPRL